MKLSSNILTFFCLFAPVSADRFDEHGPESRNFIRRGLAKGAKAPKAAKTGGSKGSKGSKSPKAGKKGGSKGAKAPKPLPASKKFALDLAAFWDYECPEDDIGECACSAGYEPNTDSFAVVPNCVDIDECITGGPGDICATEGLLCSNLDGSFCCTDDGRFIKNFTMTDETLVFSDVVLPPSSENVTLLVLLTGDFGSTFEFATVLDEGGMTIGVTGSAPDGLDCNEVPHVFSFEIAKDDFNAIVSDGNATFTVDLSDDVDAFCDKNQVGLDFVYPELPNSFSMACF